MDLKPRLKQLLEVEHDDERAVVARAGEVEELPAYAWSASAYLSHFRHWRGVFVRQIVDVLAGRVTGAPPEDLDAVNAEHLERDLKTPPDELVHGWESSWGDVLELLESCSEDDLKRDPGWYGAPTVGAALIRNSYTHSRDHLVDFWLDRGDREKAAELCEDLSSVTGEFAALHPRFPAAHLFYRGLGLALRGEGALALEAFKEAVKGRPDIATALREDTRLAFVRDLPGFGEVVGERAEDGLGRG